MKRSPALAARRQHRHQPRSTPSALLADAARATLPGGLLPRGGKPRQVGSACWDSPAGVPASTTGCSTPLPAVATSPRRGHVLPPPAHESAWLASGSRSALLTCAPAARRTGRARRLLLAGRQRRPLSPQQADRRRLSRRRQQAAGAARARRGRGRRRQAGGAAHDGLHRRPGHAEPRALPAADLERRGRAARPGPAVSVLPRPPARRAARGVPARLAAPEDWMSSGNTRLRSQCSAVLAVCICRAARMLVTERFPEIVAAAGALANVTVLDGEIVVGRPVRSRPFACCGTHRSQDADPQGAPTRRSPARLDLPRRRPTCASGRRASGGAARSADAGPRDPSSPLETRSTCEASPR